MQKEMRHCIDLKLQFPNLICGKQHLKPAARHILTYVGFDLVGAEDRPNHIGFYKKELDAFRETCEKLDLDIPFMFHAGETLLDTGGSSDPENSNLYDAVVLKSKRIGHGFALMKHPHLVEKFKKTKTSDGICIELCPISNELLHLCRNVKEHPYPELLAAGIPCTVNSDNPSLFR
jgi:adenosine deaminase CECR1